MTPARARALATLVGTCVLLACTCARATKSSRVLVLGERAPSPTVAEALARVRAELSAAGFAVDARTLADDETARSAVEQAIVDPGTVAAISLVDVERTAGEDGATVDVWSAERLTGKTSVQRIAARPRALEHNAAAVVAVRAVEVLRASLLELSLPARAADAPVRREQPPADVAAFVAAPAADRASLAHGLIVSAALAVLAPPTLRGEIALAPRFTFGAGGRWLGVRAVVVGPSSATNHSAAAGRATVHQLTAGGELLMAWPSAGRLLLGVALGGGVASVSVAGTGNAPWVGESPSLVTGYGSAGLEAAARIGGPFLLDVTLTALAFTRAATVRIADDVVASLGRPSLVAAIGVAAGF